MFIANYITLSRLILGPLFLLFYWGYESLHIPFTTVPYILLGLLFFSELTDLVDGYLARKYHQVTDLGKILDPMADSIYRISVFLTFTLPPISLPIWILFLMIYRESIISALRTVCALKGFALAARSSGKIKAILQGFVSLAILIMLALYTSQIISLKALQVYSFYLALAAALYTAFSGIDYIYSNRNYVCRILHNKSSTG